MKIIIGIDPSYKNTGFSIFIDGKKKMIKSLHLQDQHSKLSKSECRKMIRDYTNKCLDKCEMIDGDVQIIIERIRLTSQGFLNMDYIKSIGALNSVIVDAANERDIEVFSVDTRCWKARVVGTCNGKENEYGVKDTKWPTIEFCLNKGWEKDLLIEMKRKRKDTFERDGKIWKYNDDAADSACMALFGFENDEKHLKKET